MRGNKEDRKQRENGKEGKEGWRISGKGKKVGNGKENRRKIRNRNEEENEKGRKENSYGRKDDR